MKGATVPETRSARRLPGRTWLRRAGLVLALAGMVQVGGAGAASAHAVGGGPAASNYRTNVRGIEPAIPGLSVRAVDGGNQLELTNRGAQEVIILGYENEPYLRVGPSGAFENERSPSTFSNRSTTAPTQIPAEFSAAAQPDRRRVSSQPVVVFHDHRAHWSGGADPAAVQRARSKRQLVTPNGVWTGSTAPVVTLLYGSATSFAGWVIAAIAIQRLLTGKRPRPAGAKPPRASGSPTTQGPTGSANRQRGSSGGSGGSMKSPRKTGGR